MITVQKEEAWKASHLTEGTVMDPDYSLPLNVALITLQVTVATSCRMNLEFYFSLSLSDHCLAGAG